MICLLASGAARAAPRIAIGPVVGDAKRLIPTQLAEALCGTLECVLWREVSSRGAPDLRRARAREVKGILVGRLARGAGGRTAVLSLLSGQPRPVGSWTFPLTRTGRLSEEDLSRLEVEVTALVQPAPVRARATPPPPLPPPSAPTPTRGQPGARPPPAAAAEPVRPRVVAPTRPASPAAGPAAARPAGHEPPAPRPAPAEPAPWMFALEAGGFLRGRTLEYGGVGAMSGKLYGFDAHSISGPRLGAELFALARSGSAALRGLGLFGSWETSVALSTATPSGERRDTRYTAYEAGVTWRAPPLGTLGLVLAPTLSWRGYALTVAPPLAGLPDAKLTGVGAGLGAEGRFGRVVFLARAGYVRWLVAKELIEGNPPFFPGGSAAAFEVEGGLGVRLSGPFSVRVIGAYSLTRYTLDADPTRTYAATRADDRLFGARAVGRLEL
jgi:hypothetical protein